MGIKLKEWGRDWATARGLGMRLKEWVETGNETEGMG